MIIVTGLPSGQRLSCPLQTFTTSARAIVGTELFLFEISATSLAAAVAVRAPSTRMIARVSRDNVAVARLRTVILRLCFRRAQPSTAESPCTTEGNKKARSEVRGHRSEV